MTAGAPAIARAQRPIRLPRRLASLSRADLLALGLLVLLPLALYLPALLTGRVTVPGDDLSQNLPLRVLAGRMLAAGRLPAWDPYVWSGTPLLAGWNAGALFPGTFLFALFPMALAWTLNLLAAPLCCGIGTFLLLRRLRTGALGALVGALVFTYTGFMSGQTVHLGLVQGSAFMPLVLLGVDLLGDHRERRARCALIALVGISLALTVLAGDPRAITSTAIAAALWVLARLWWPHAAGDGTATPNRIRGSYLVSIAAAVALGAALSALQWLPGITFLSNSQRSSAAYVFFGAGSIAPARLALDLLLPFVEGGNTNLGQPSFVGPYNLAEITMGCGLVSLAAAVGYALVLLTRLGARLRAERVHQLDDRHLGLLVVLGALGVVLTLGSMTPLGHLLVHLPLFGNERLQNRNDILFDLPLALFAGFFVDDLGRPESELRRLLATRSRLLLLLPMVGAGALACYGLIRPAAFARELKLPSGAGNVIAAVAPYLVTTLLLALGAAVALLLAHRLSAPLAQRLVAAVVLGEVALFGVNASYASVPSAALATTTPLSATLRSFTGETGRFALFNPGFQGTGANTNAAVEIGETDDNVIQQDPSVEGYGSIVNGTYQDATNTHYLENLSEGALSSATSDILDLRTLVTLRAYFDEPIAPAAPIPLVTAPGVVKAPPGAGGIPPYFAGPWAISPTAPATFDLASPRVMRRATIELDPGAGAPALLRIEAITAGGAVIQRTAAVHDGTAQVTLAGVRDEYLRVSDPGGARALIGAVVVVVTRPVQRLLLAGALQGTLAPPHWHFAGTVGGVFSMWQNSQTAGLAWLEPPGATAPDTARRAPGSVAVSVNSTGAPEHAVVDTPRPATLVRSEGYSGGWTARIQPVGGGPAQVLTARRLGLVQAITLPPGRWLVTWRYAPTSLLVALVGTSCGGGLLLALLVLGRRRRPGRD